MLKEKCIKYKQEMKTASVKASQSIAREETQLLEAMTEVWNTKDLQQSIKTELLIILDSPIIFELWWKTVSPGLN